MLKTNKEMQEEIIRNKLMNQSIHLEMLRFKRNKLDLEIQNLEVKYQKLQEYLNNFGKPTKNEISSIQISEENEPLEELPELPEIPDEDLFPARE